MKALARRKCLREHFERIHCRGLIKDVAFTGAFGTVAQGSPNFLVATAGIPGLPPLPEEIGMPNLKRLCKSMEIELDDTVSYDVSPSHLLFRDSRRSDLLERQFGMPMEVPAYRGEVCGESLGLFEKIHGTSGVWVERVRSVGRAKLLAKRSQD